MQQSIKHALNSSQGIRAMSIWVACVATWGHDGNQVQVTARDYVWVCGPVIVKVYNVHGPWCCLP